MLIVTSDDHHPKKCEGCKSKNGHFNGQSFFCYDCRIETEAGKPTSEDYDAPEQCEGCGKGIHNGRFLARYLRITDGPFLVGDCCGDRTTGIFKSEYDPDSDENKK